MKKDPSCEERAQVSPAILNYSSFSTAGPGNLWQVPRDVDETQKSLIYHVETRNAKIVARICSGSNLALGSHASVRDHADASYRTSKIPDNSE